MIESVRIGGVNYEVTLDPMVTNQGQQVRGTFDNYLSEIKIDSDMRTPQRLITLLHEITHGILDHAGFKDHDERLVEAISYGFSQVLMDNPELRSYINRVANKHGIRRSHSD